MNLEEREEIVIVLGLIRQGYPKEAFLRLQRLLLRGVYPQKSPKSGLELATNTKAPTVDIKDGHLLVNDEGWLIEVDVIERIEQLIKKAIEDGEIKKAR